jgi:hypothetical protein
MIRATKMTDTLTYRKKRRKESVNRFLRGEARRPYVLRTDIANGLKDQSADFADGKNIENQSNSSCTCQETLGHFSDMFKNMLHTGQKLIDRASNQQPKRPDKKYRNINQQNKWLLENVFDSYGNYIFCFCCIKNILGVGGKRLHRLREIKRQQAVSPTIQIRKDQVPVERACDIVAPKYVTNVLTWWMNLESSSIVELRSPPKLHHGKSNYNKEEILPCFLTFIDNNSQPNGRKVGSHGPLFFLNSKFDRINAPSAFEADKPEQWKRRSLVYEFNRTLEGNKRISNGTAKKWLKAHRPKHAISPRKTDYCEMCAECQEQKRRHETITMRLQQNGNGNEDEIRESIALAESYGLLLEEHKMDAGRELQHYRQETNKCRNLYYHIKELQKKELKSKEDKTKLQELMRQFTFTLSLDYQQSKLTPHWGFSAQPSETYYLRKLSHTIFGIVDHALANNAVYVVDERVGGSKNGDITISLINHYIHQELPPWARNLCLFMDNGATNKNQFMIQWGINVVERGDYDTIRMCYFVPGHGKNDADRLFSRISNAFDNNDVFDTEQLVALIQDTIDPTGICIQINNHDIVNWKELLAKKYITFKEIKRNRDFLIKRNPKGKVVVYHKTCCYMGDYANQDLLKKNVNIDLDLNEEIKNFTYEVKNMGSNLSQEKVNDLVKMYDKFIDPRLRPKWLPASQSITMPHVTTFSPSSEFARQHRERLKKRKNCINGTTK